MRATIKMIAEKAGVSIGTVDRVIHNRPYVKQEVRQRVLQVMEELDYRPNRVASALAMSGTPRRLVVIQPNWLGYYVRSEMDAGVARFREETRDYNVNVDICCYPKGDTVQMMRLLNDAAENGAQAIALCASDCEEVRSKLEQLAERGIPVVTFNSDLPGARRLCYVGEDAHRAGRIAGEIAAKFLRPGDRPLLVYAGQAYAGHRERLFGFLERIEELGFQKKACQILETHDDHDETFRAVREALENDPELSYIYMANFSVPACVEAIRQCKRVGRVRVLAHDSSAEIREFLKEGLVDFTIGQDLAYQSYQALTVLFRAVTEHWRPEQDCYYSPSPILNCET